MNEEWKQLLEAARKVAVPHDISSEMTVGSVGSAVMSASGKIYTGICIDTNCSLGFCAERNAISTMFTQGEYAITKVVSVYYTGKVMPSCGACREFMMHMGPDAGSIEMMLNDNGDIVRLKDLMPAYVYD